MAVLKVNPNRSTMSGLKTKLESAERGHKLLKDKQDGLMRQFISLIRKNKDLREEVERELSKSFGDFLLASAAMSPEMLEDALSSPSQKLLVAIEAVNLMSVNVPKMEFKRGDDETMYPYGFVNTSAELDDAIARLNLVMDKLLELAEVEKACQLMADEIESTRRRVNALEYRTIPDYRDTIKFIRMKLDENDRATTTRLMKVKELIAQQELEAANNR